MKIKKLEWRNIFSYGDDITTLEFSDEGKLWQLSGKSGSGKSSILSIPKLLLFGKTEGSDGRSVNASDIANRLNKKGWIRGEITKGNDEYIIERKFSPSGLIIYKNGENLDKAGLKNMQSIIDVDILDGLPYNIFSNVMTLSLNNFKSFISMTPADKRQIIDKIFSLEVINKVYELVKKDMRDLGNAINTSNSQIFSLNRTIQTSQEEIDALEKKVSVDTEKVLSELKDKIQYVSDLQNQQNEYYSQYYAKSNDIAIEERKINSMIVSENADIRQINEKINLFNADKCPTCGTSFNSSEFDHIREELNKKLQDKLNIVSTYQIKLNEINSGKNEINANLSVIQNNINKLISKKNELIGRYKSIEDSAKNSVEAQSIQNIIDSTNKSKESLEKSIKESNEKMKLLSVMETMYSADGIKQTMMSNYIPSLNEEIAETFSFLGFPYTLTFDSAFNPHLQHLMIDIKPQSLSTGEHKKVDLTVLCSLLKLIKRKYPQLNLVCLDETVSSLDYESSTDIIRYLKEISKTMNVNIFIVSHTQLDENLFDEHLYVEKTAGYSKLIKK